MANAEEDPDRGPPNYSSHWTTAPEVPTGDFRSERLPSNETEGAPYEQEQMPPSFSGDPAAPADREWFRSLIMPNIKAGALDALTLLVDLPATVAGQLGGAAAEALGFPTVAANLRNPVLLSDFTRAAFELPKAVEEVVTGEDARWTAGFDATPRAPENAKERFWGEVAYITGSGPSFPAGLSVALRTGKGSMHHLLSSAGSRGIGSREARRLVGLSAQQPNVLEALGQVAKVYANTFVRGMGSKVPETLLLKETGFAALAGVGSASTQALLGDESGRLMMDLGEGEVDVMPSLKVLGSIGLPVAAAHTPGVIGLAVAKSKVVPLLRWIGQKTKVFAKSLGAGLTAEGQADMASRILMAATADPTFMTEVFLPAVEAGLFQSPGKSTPVRFENGVAIPENGGVRPDTAQVLKQLGLDDTRLARLDLELRQKGNNAHARIGEETRRSKLLDQAFELLGRRIGPGDEAATAETVRRAMDTLDAEAVAIVDDAVFNARAAYEALEPVVGRAEASVRAVEYLEQARAGTAKVTRALWSEDLVGTAHVDTKALGDWAAQRIVEQGRAAVVTPGLEYLYMLAGRTRLEKMGWTEKGKPLRLAKDDGSPVSEEAVGNNGLFDRFGEPGTVTADPIKIIDVQNFRAQVGAQSRLVGRQGKSNVKHWYDIIRDHIDDAVLTRENFTDKGLSESNLQNIEIGRDWVNSAKSRFGPNSPIGRILYKGVEPLPEEFLTALIKPGPGAGARVELWRDALNEPQKVVDGDTVTWRPDPEASLVPEGGVNVVEAELLRRFTETAPDGVVTQKGVDRFLVQYKEAISKFPGMREKFNDLKAFQKAVDEMSSMLTMPNKETVLSARKKGATDADIGTARRLLEDALESRRLAHVASDYLGVDVDAAATKFINGDPNTLQRSANDIDALLKADDNALQGFRGALFRAMRKSSALADKDGTPVPGIDTAKFVAMKEKLRPFLEKFWTPEQLTVLDEIGKGGPLQRTGTDIRPSGPGTAAAASFAQTEVVQQAGRIGGQAFLGGLLGVNTLAAATGGKKISGYLFEKIGSEKIWKHVEDALRDPEIAAALVKRFQTLKSWEPTDSVKGAADEALSDPAALASRGASEAKDTLKDAATHISKYLSNYSQEAIGRAVRFGLLPAQSEARSMTLEEDWQMGYPLRHFIYEDNRIRYEIEQENRQSAAPPRRRFNPENMVSIPAAPVSGSALSLPLFSPGTAAPYTQDAPGTAARGAKVFPFDPIFAGLEDGGLKDGGHIEGGGIMSVPCKPRQRVG